MQFLDPFSFQTKRKIILYFIMYNVSCFPKKNKSVNILQEQEKKNPDFVAFKELQENKDEMNGLKLRALLITPIQRIPR